MKRSGVSFNIEWTPLERGLMEYMAPWTNPVLVIRLLKEPDPMMLAAAVIGALEEVPRFRITLCDNGFTEIPNWRERGFLKLAPRAESPFSTAETLASKTFNQKDEPVFAISLSQDAGGGAVLSAACSCVAADVLSLASFVGRILQYYYYKMGTGGRPQPLPHQLPNLPDITELTGQEEREIHNLWDTLLLSRPASETGCMLFRVPKTVGPTRPHYIAIRLDRQAALSLRMKVKEKGLSVTIINSILVCDALSDCASKLPDAVRLTIPVDLRRYLDDQVRFGPFTLPQTVDFPLSMLRSDRWASAAMIETLFRAGLTWKRSIHELSLPSPIDEWPSPGRLTRDGSKIYIRPLIEGAANLGDLSQVIGGKALGIQEAYAVSTTPALVGFDDFMTLSALLWLPDNATEIADSLVHALIDKFSNLTGGAVEAV